MSGGDAEPLLRYGATSNRYRGAAGAANERSSTLKAGARVAGYRRSFSLLWTLFCWLLIITLGVAALLIAAGLVGLSASPWTMPVIEKSLTVQQPLPDVFGFVAEFSNIDKWDPGCISSKKRGTAPTDVGTEYDLVTVFKGKESNMLYKVTKWEKPDEVGENKKGLVQLFGKGPTATGLDTISFESVSGNATKLTYTADIQLTGIYWFFTPLVRADIMQLGDAAIHGLAKHYGM